MKKIAGIVCGLCVVFAVVTPVVAQSKGDEPAVPKEKPASLPNLGVWLVTGKDQAGNAWIAPLVFVKDIDAQTNTGFFDWKSEVGFGREIFKGTFDPKTRKLKLQGTEYAFKEGNVVLGIYEAVLSRDGLKLEEGVWVGGIEGSWTAVWKSALPK